MEQLHLTLPAARSMSPSKRTSRQWQLPDGAPVVMLPGRLTRWKGQLVLIEALARLGRSDLRCLFVGSGDERYRRELEAHAAKLGLGAAVQIVDECRDIVREMLDGPFRGAASRFIVTSPTPLGYAGEEVVPITPMTVPPQDEVAEPDDLYDYEASALFLDRVTELSESLTDHMDPDAVAELINAGRYQPGG